MGVMHNLTLPFLASVPVGHRARTYRAERFVQSTGWIGAGTAGVLYDCDTGVVFASQQGARPALLPGEPRPETADLRWVPEHEGKVVYCIVITRGTTGSLREVSVTTHLGIEPESGAPYR
jgi:hypothetical protein